jgi:hypothetical protein
MLGRAYLDPGSRASGRYDPPRRCAVITPCGPVLLASRYPAGTGILWLRDYPRAAPHNVAVEYEDGSRAVIPFPRRLRRAGRVS